MHVLQAPLIILLLSSTPVAAQTRIPTPQQVEELKQRRDPPPTEQSVVYQKRLELCRKKHRQTQEDVDRCMRDGE